MATDCRVGGNKLWRKNNYYLQKLALELRNLTVLGERKPPPRPKSQPKVILIRIKISGSGGLPEWSATKML